MYRDIREQEFEEATELILNLHANQKLKPYIIIVTYNNQDLNSTTNNES